MLCMPASHTHTTPLPPCPNLQGGGRMKKAAAEGAATAQGAAAASGERAQKAASEATAAAATPFLAQANERQSSGVPKEE